MTTSMSCVKAAMHGTLLSGIGTQLFQITRQKERKWIKKKERLPRYEHHETLIKYVEPEMV